MMFPKFFKVAMLRKPKPASLTLRLSVIVEPDGTLFHAFAPAFPGLHADGATEHEATRNLIAEFPAYFGSLAKHGDPLPIGPDCTVERHEVIPDVPIGAFLHHITLEWPSLQTSGLS